MKADITRDTFHPRRHFSEVITLQGRPVLDADLNEQAAIHRHYQRALAVDLIGPHGGPNDRPEFGEVQEARLGFDLIATITDELKKKLPENFSLGGNNVFLGPGRYWVYGLLCEAEDYFLLRPPDRPDPDHPVAVQPDLDLANFNFDLQALYLVYLDVWERFETAVEDERIPEAALGGVESSARLKVVYQVRLMKIDLTLDKLLPQIKTQKGFLELLKIDYPLNPPTDRLKARPAPSAGQSEPDPDCPLDPEAQYRGDENQLYRVEIHRGVPASKATFVWARDNASITFPIRSAQGGEVTLDTLGRDAIQAIEQDQWVEILDDDIALDFDPDDRQAARAGHLYQVTDVDTDHFVVKLANPDGSAPALSYPADGTKHPFLRRWDYSGPEPGDVSSGVDLNIPPLDDDGALKVQESPDEWIDLEDGIQIQFPRSPNPEAPRAYRTGDYWLIPARVATGSGTGDVEWPTAVIQKDGQSHREPLPLPPRRNRRYYAPLWLLHTDDTGITINGDKKPIDLRRRIIPRTQSDLDKQT